jgi:TonB-dependent SusC/RagA subfamily outer membrane receptor
MLKYRYVFLIAIGINLMVFMPGYAQNNLAQALNNLQKQAAEYPTEKVYLHIDRPFYGAGDTIWFKAYVVTGATHHLSGLSGVLNVELINQQNTLIRHIKLPVVNGITRGDFILGDTITEGNYRLRAYTNWMRNAGPDFFFDKTIRIVNAVDNSVFAYTTYTYPLINGRHLINADVVYTGPDKMPYAAKEVSYQIDLSGGKKASGKGITDDKGILHISVFNPSPDKQSKGRLSTSIVLDNKHTVNKIIPFKSTIDQVDVQFFPESGSLINGLVSKVAFKAVGADGLGSNITGTVTDDQNNNITELSTTHLGMGYFFLAPEAGKTYKAHITYGNGATSIVDLPKSADKGNVMAIHTDSAKVVIKMARKGDETIADSLTLIVDAGGEIYAQAKAQPGKTNFTAVVAKNKLPSGIVRFTLFSGSGEPLNERLVFVQNPDQLNLSIRTTNKINAQQRQVKIDLNAKESGGQPVQGNFSVAVIDESKISFDEAAESTIFSNLLLSADIKGYIEKPNYYFTNSDKKTAADLDVLMMTQGYHRYEWKQVMNGKKPDIVYPFEKALTIAGTINGTDGLPLNNSKLTLINKATNLLLDTLTDKNGRFKYDLDYMDGSKFVLKAGEINGDNFLVKLDNAAGPVSENTNSPDELMNPDAGVDSYLQNSKSEHDVEVKYHIGNHTTILKQVNIKADRQKTERQLEIEHAVEFSSNLNGKGNADQVVTSAVFEGMGCPTVSQCLEGKLKGITFDPQGFPQSTRGRSSIHMSTKMLVIIDGILSQTTSQTGGVNDVNPQDISSIEVLTSAGTTAIYGSRGANGVLIITTKHDSGYTASKKNSGNISPQGYYKAREFYSPKYDATVATPIPDLRTLIYWKPIIQTDKNGDASFEYFNADSKGPYRVVVEGIDYKSGSIGRQVVTYSVPQ